MEELNAFTFIRDYWHVAFIIFSMGGYAAALWMMREHIKTLFQRTDNHDVLNKQANDTERLSHSNQDRLNIMEAKNAVLEEKLTNLLLMTNETKNLVMSLVHEFRNGSRKTDKS